VLLISLLEQELEYRWCRVFVIKWSVRPRVITFVVFYKFVVCVLRLHRVAEERSLESCFHIGDLMTLRTLAPCEIRLSEVRLTS